MLNFKIYGNTDTGKKRTNNEDAFIAQTLWNDSLLAVAIDGVGGYEGGEVAAEAAQKTILEYLQAYSNGERLSLLTQAVTQANNSIYEKRETHNGCQQMGCVLTAALFDLENGQLNMAHIGDTRLYCYNNNILTKLSHDHSEIGYQEEIGELTEEQAMSHPQRNVINRIVGAELHKIDDLHFIDSAVFPLIHGATYLLCSDGLCDMLTSNEIASVLEPDISIEEKAQRLIDFANEKGGNDNITVVLVEINGEIPVVQENEIIEIQTVDKEVISDKRKKNKKAKRFLIVLGIIILSFISGITGGWFGQKMFQTQNDLKKSVPLIDSLKTQPTDTINIIETNDTITVI